MEIAKKRKDEIENFTHELGMNYTREPERLKKIFKYIMAVIVVATGLLINGIYQKDDKQKFIAVMLVVAIFLGVVYDTAKSLLSEDASIRDLARNEERVSVASNDEEAATADFVSKVKNL